MNGYGEIEGKSSGGGTGPVTAKGGGKREQVDQQGPETKRCPLMEDVSECQEFYKGESDN